MSISAHPLSVSGAVLYTLPEIHDLRGTLTVGNFLHDIPFTPKRYFMVYNVPGEHMRGEHAHRTCAQFLICVHGSVHVLVDDGTQREAVVLNAPTRGLYVPPKLWAAQYKHSDDAVLLVFASELYDPADYIRDYEAFLKEFG